ncbi:hypothetical protein EHQ12_12140 [Leptospira gomenensis]|uniref:DUF5683 domain-containing protein n=1 Tax=Leptospira gomenensis TaxID=2484974 RepID=A0A5F1Y9J7_9LEPT|nr:DUF5683 domain-containing protein [Leptospira gomenensis]TGK32688.1 hypothetical protein EHQ17_11985 [Leptospira gomenensis]TGK36836.1 hypothetical protein EHQ12_12140 [Leptospira gomenensis]TGK39911.1 hypothetical protein EHQ07_19440 [Leptospira gomenensis]TGK58046.1 hypothetical protein EHQ13_14340 [Leptospira gomenensis]
MFSKNYFRVFIPFLFLFPSLLFSESIIFKDGTVFKGRVSSQNAHTVTVRGQDGKVQEISKLRILKIVYKDVSNEEALRIKKEEETKLAEQELKRKEQAEQKKNEEEAAQKAKAEKQKQDLIDAETKKAEAALNEKERLARIQQRGLGPWSVTWRSAVLPGWGQWTDERKIPAVVYSALFVSSLYLVYRENQIYINSVRDLNHKNNPYETYLPIPSFSDPIALYLYSKPFEEQREKVNQNYQNLQLSIGAALTIYLLNLLDAYWFHPRFAKTASSSLIFDYNPMARLESGTAFGSPSASVEGQWKLGLRFSLE